MPVREQRVTPLELFLDLVFVFAITQVTGFLSSHPTWPGFFRALLLLSVLWWAWSGYAWLTNTLDPEEGAVRLIVLAAVSAMLVMSLAVPRAFGTTGVIFGVAYGAVRALHLVLFVVASRGNHDLFRAVLRIVPTAMAGAALLVIAGFAHGDAQLWLWAGAALINYLGATVGHMQGFNVSSAHFVERFGQIVMIALGESVVAIGVGARNLPLDTNVLGAALVGMVVVSCIWWSYFDWVIYVAVTHLEDARGARRAQLARDAYSYLHLPMVAGIVLFAFGLKASLPDATRQLHTIPLVGLIGGVALYFAAHVALRLRIGGGFGRGRPAAALLLIALYPAALHLSGLATLGLVAAVCVGLIAYEALRHRDARAVIRSRRTALTPVDVRGLEGSQLGRSQSTR